MAIDTAVLRAACNTTTGNQDFTTTDFGGGTPTAALFFVTGCTTDGTEAQLTYMCGAATSTAVASYCHAGKDNTNTSDSRRSYDNASLIGYRFQGSTDFKGTVSFITNGVRVNWSDAPNSAYLMTVVLLGGADLSAHLHNFGSIAAAGTETATTNFQPHLILFGGNGALDTDTGSNGDGTGAIGVYDWDGGTSPFNGTIGFSATEGQATSASGTQYSTTDVLAHPHYDTQADYLHLDLSAITSTSYTVQNNTAVSVISNFGLALNVGTNGYKAWEETTPTNTGNWAVTGVGFKPQLVIGLLTHSTAAGIISTGTTAGVDAVSVFTPTAEFCNTNMTEDGQSASMRAKGLSDNIAVNMPSADGVSKYNGSLVSMDSDGFTLNMAGVSGTAHKWIFIAIEEDAAGHTANLPQDTITVTGYAPSASHSQNLKANLPQGSVTVTGYAPSATLTTGDQASIALGSMSVTGFAPSAAHTQNLRSNLPQGSIAVTGNAPSATHTQNLKANVPQGAVTTTGYAPSATLTEGSQASIALGSVSVAGFAPSAAHTQNLKSNIPQGAVTVTGYAPSATLTITGQDEANLPQGTITVTGYAPSATLTQNHAASIPLGSFTVNGFAPTATLTGVVEAVTRRGGAGKHKKRPQRKIMVGGIVYTVGSLEEEVAVWEAHKRKVLGEREGLAAEIEARAIDQKIQYVVKLAKAQEIQATSGTRKTEAALVQYVSARRAKIQSMVRELLGNLG